MTQGHDKSQTKTARIALCDVPAALGLLSRLPVSVDTDVATTRGAKAAWAYPIAGCVLALIAGAVGQAALWVGLSHLVVAGIVIATLVIITGCMHEDGLADAADGLWGGWEKTRRLEIMKDSHIGAYGVLALVIGVGLRWQALAVVIGAGHMWAGVIATAMLSRAVMVPLMARLPHAREGGLSHAVGRPDITTARIAEAIAVVGALVLLQGLGLVAIGVALVATASCAAIAKAKIGGQTGDILGATQQVTEITVLLALAALMGA